MLPKVSIQIPTYNQSEYLSLAIDSALMQDYKNLEIVIADDCSEDDTKEIVSGFQDSRIRYFCNPANIGRVANYRKALYEYCTGDWVVNLDGDDCYVDAGFISRAMSLISQFKKKGNSIVFYQAAIMVKNEKTGEQSKKSHHILRGREFGVFRDYYLKVYRKNAFFSHLTTIYKRDTALKIGFYEYDTLNTDFESIAKLSFYGDAILDNSIAGMWRLHEGNATYGFKEFIKKSTRDLMGRLDRYAKEANPVMYAQGLGKVVKKENELLHLEWLADFGLFKELVYYIIKYQRGYFRIPLLIVKSLIR
jgi:glycosyltransferase involved in cell wall biosynthesis